MAEPAELIFADRSSGLPTDCASPGNSHDAAKGSRISTSESGQRDYGRS